MEVLESLAPVPSEEVVAIRPKGEGIERFRRRVEPASGISSLSELPDLPAPQENNSIFSHRSFSDSGATPSSGEGEWDSGHAASSKTKKSEIAGEDASGSGEGSGILQHEPTEQEKPVVVTPATLTSDDEGSSVAPSSLAGAATAQPPPVATSHNGENKPSNAVAGAVSFNAVEPEETGSAQLRSVSNMSALTQTKTIIKESPAAQLPKEEVQQTATTNKDAPESSGVEEAAHFVSSAVTKQAHTASGSGESSGSGLSADELAFIAGLKKAKGQQSTPLQTPQRAKLPGSVGSDEDDDDNDNVDESGDASAEQSDSSASGAQEDETTSSQSDEDQNEEAQQRSKTSQRLGENASEDDDDDDDDDDVSADGSGSASGDDEDYDDEDDSGESSADKSERRDTIVDVASGSGVDFLSGVGDSDSEDDSSESSGEDDEPEDDLPGSIGEVNDISKLEQKPVQAETAPGFAFASASGVPPGSHELAPASGSGLPDVRQQSVKKPMLDQTSPKASIPSSGSGEEELPGSVGGISDIGQVESATHTETNSAASGSGDFKTTSQYKQDESLLQQVLQSESSGSGESEKQDESLPGSVGGQINLEETISASGSKAEPLAIVSPDFGTGSGESPKLRSWEPVVSLPQESLNSGSGSDEKFSGSGIADNLESLASSSEDETLPGSVGAVGPNLMTMASPENKPGSGMADQSGSGSGVGGSGLQEEVNLMRAFKFGDSSGSGLEQLDNNETHVENEIDSVNITKPLPAFGDGSNVTQSENSTIIAQTKENSAVKNNESSGEFGLLQSLQPFGGSGTAEEPLPGGFGNGDSTDIQSLAGSGGEDASGVTLSSGSFGSFMDEGISGSGSGVANSDVISELSGGSSSGSGKFSSDSEELQSLSKKDYAPTASALASASASATQDSGSSSGSGNSPLPVAKHNYSPTIKRVGTGISFTPMAASASGSSSSGQSDSSASALPGSVGVEESFSSSGSAVFDTSGSGFIPIGDIPQEDLLNTEVETSVSGSDEINVVESGAGEGSGAHSNKDEEVEETALRSHTDNLKPISFNLDSAGLQADVQAALGKTPINLGVGSGSTYGLGSGGGIDYGSTSDFLSGSGGSGTLELTPATTPSDAIVNLFGNTFGSAGKENSRSSNNSVASSDEGSSFKHQKQGKNRHQIPVSGNDETAFSDDEEQVRFCFSRDISY